MRRPVFREQSRPRFKTRGCLAFRPSPWCDGLEKQNTRKAAFRSKAYVWVDFTERRRHTDEVCATKTRIAAEREKDTLKS